MASPLFLHLRQNQFSKVRKGLKVSPYHSMILSMAVTVVICYFLGLSKFRLRLIVAFATYLVGTTIIYKINPGIQIPEVPYGVGSLAIEIRNFLIGFPQNYELYFYLGMLVVCLISYILGSFKKKVKA